MELKLFWTDFSQKELEKIYQYHREKAGIRIAKKLVNGIYNETLKLQRQPEIGQAEELLKNRNQGFRYLVYKNYKVIYWINRLGLWLLMPYLITEFDISALNHGLIVGTVNILFWIFILWLVFKVFMTTELKKYMKLLIPLVVLVIAITKGNDIGKLIWENVNDDVKTEEVLEITQAEFNATQPNKVYISSDYEKETIEPATYNETGKLYSIFIYNETENSIIANQKITIKPNESFVFKIPDTMGIAINNGIQFFFGETEGLEVIDNKIQVSGLGGEWLDKLNVPESTDFAFSILNPGEGDPIPEE